MPAIVSEPVRIGFLLSLFFVLSTIYNLAIPIFEAPDEKSHFLFINWISENGRLPHILEDQAAIGHEVAQPPLYYWAVAQAVSSIDMSDVWEVAPDNPHWRYLGDPHVYYHAPTEHFPFQKTVLAVHVGRLLSTVMGIGTLFLIYAFVRLLQPSLAWLAAAFVAFNPQFIAVSASINNDNLLIMWCACLLWLVVRLRQQLDQPTLTAAKWGTAFIIGIIYGLSAITKLSGLAFGPIIALAILWGSDWRNLGDRLGLGLMSAAGLFASAGWWFWRNWQLYRDPLAYRPLGLAHEAISRKIPLDWSAAIVESGDVGRTFWYSLANAQIEIHPIFYWLINGLVLLGLLGAGQRLVRERSAVQILLWLWLALMGGLLLIWVREMNNAAQGRLLFPALPALAYLIVSGLDQMPRVGRWLSAGLVSLLLLLATLAPWISIRPVFAPPNTWRGEVASPLEATFNGEIKLVGVDVTASRLGIGDTLPIALFWEGVEPISASYVITLRLFDVTGREVSQRDFLPAQGRYPTVSWEPQRLFRDYYELPAVSDAAVPGRATIHVALHTWDNSADLLPVLRNGVDAGDGLIIGEVVIGQPTELVPPPNPLDTRFGNVASLDGYDLPSPISAGEPLPITLYWESTAVTDQPYTVFVHMLDSGGGLVAQADSSPQGGRYPLVLWEPGEQVVDPRVIETSSLESGSYSLAVGIYHSVSGERLPVTGERVDVAMRAQLIGPLVIE